MAKEKIYKCRYNHCKHETKDVLASEAVKEGNRYYHKDCYKTKEDINKIVELFSEHVNPNVVFAVLRKVINNIVFTRGVDSGLLLFGLNYYISNKITMVGLIPGRVTYLILFHLPAPSMAAASYREGSMDVMAAR